MTVKNVQIVTAVERRRKWSESEKAAIVSESMAAGVTMLAVARKYDLHPRAIYRWKEKLMATSVESPLALPPPAPKRRGRPPRHKLPAPAMDVIPAPKVFAVEAAPLPAAAAVPDSVRLVVGDLVITISTSSRG